jgi:hypothetical protein
MRVSGVELVRANGYIGYSEKTGLNEKSENAMMVGKLT